MPAIAFDRYYRYGELTDLLKGYASKYPNLVTLVSIGKSFEGRDIWLLEVTDGTTGPASSKPAYWCDGNIHASEVSASTAVLRILEMLCTEQPQVLKTRAFYLVPRLNPDGAEWALADVPKIIRSSTRPYPFDEEDPYGLERMDLDGDGRILNMRVPDPNGAWKVCEEEPRLLVRRGPGEEGAVYYRLMPEGLFHNFDGATMRGRKIKEGLDLNRNFPAGWRPEGEQFGAGPFPTSEPEARAMVEAVTSRPNITGSIHFHTYSGVNLRPPGRTPDDDIPSEDLWVYKSFGQKGEEITGYPALSIWHDFRYHPKEVISGDQDEWMYEHRGVFAWTCEIWSPTRQAGLKDAKPIEWFREHPVADDLAMLRWSDEKLDGKGHIDWYDFDHPQLGKVQLGGWDHLYAFRNPPPQFLDAEVTPLAKWAIWLAGASPQLRHRDTIIERRGEVAHVRVLVENSGWLPTNVTRLANDKLKLRGVVAELHRASEPWGKAGTSSPAWLVSGALRQQLGQLVGRSHVSAGGFGGRLDGTDDVAIFEWVLAPGSYTVEVSHERAGKLSITVEA